MPTKYKKIKIKIIEFELFFFIRIWSNKKDLPPESTLTSNFEREKTFLHFHFFFCAFYTPTSRRRCLFPCDCEVHSGGDSERLMQSDKLISNACFLNFPSPERSPHIISKQEQRGRLITHLWCQFASSLTLDTLTDLTALTSGDEVTVSKLIHKN